MNKTATVHKRSSQDDCVSLMGVRFDALDEGQVIQRVIDALALGQGGWVITSNLDHLRRSRIDTDFHSMLSEANMVVADGMPLLWAARIQGTPLPDRVTGSSLVSTLARAASKAGRSLYLFGGDPGAAEGAARQLRSRWPELRIAGCCCPPVGFEHDLEQAGRITDALVTARPDIVYVALGSPKQERLIRKLRHRLPSAWWIGVGISLGFLSGQVHRAPRWMQRAGLEWAHRLVQDPPRLAGRYLVYGLPFAGRLLGSALAGRLRKRSGSKAPANLP